jgi:hypothetical protein
MDGSRDLAPDYPSQSEAAYQQGHSAGDNPPDGMQELIGQNLCGDSYGHGPIRVNGPAENRKNRDTLRI